MKPYISIIVPVYNIEKYLEECVDSILRQKIDDIEIILVDDGSTDMSGEICDKYSERNQNVYVVHKKNGGLSDARNTGMHKALGEYILFVDGDDYIGDHALACLIKESLRQKKPDVMFLKAYKVFENGNKEQLDDSLEPGRIIGKNKIEVLSYLASLNKYPASACTKLVSRKFLENHNLFFEFGKKSEDYDWTRRLLFAAERFGTADIDYYYYRQFRLNSISNTQRYENFKDIADVLDLWIKDAEQLSKEEKKILLSFGAYVYKILLTVYFNIKKNADKNELIYGVNWLKKNKYLLNYRNDKQVRLTRAMVKIAGVSITSDLLGIYMYLKRRRKV